ncbi:MAG TPA: MBL fold metallo-hydrolase [Nocardioides sp.]|uniref:MBL fold metallo-hydrolase n=1 Tax=uncultured Nocardioides sp. TaxID=198441 RepID=UPI000EC0A64C|nr:MBL fold metallo-hydrolase [uncultured Nocardioides sp.]HCB03941.1 hypothetical protein [Nocardioides sp.]HRD62144.1 MBL fold metallo-hydrolase [Nocardioides sp.]HRI97825.1 MBL fold metallo-hydrolase [Nocardioides sp.]HRK46869.1 MBL fold metallo-hydrolase [Nocardioides sp.]
MRLTRWSHACVTLESVDRTVIVDPGIWSEPQALAGADAVLVTHEHADHVDVARLRTAGLPVWAPRGADLQGLPYTPLDPDQAFALEGFEVRTVGGRHAEVVPGQDVCVNLGYLVADADESVYHPGDALVPPAVPVTTLLVPMQANWLKTVEAIQFLRATRAEHAIGIHDAMVNDRARAGINQWLSAEGGTAYHWLAPGTTLGEDARRPRVGQLRLVVEATDFAEAAAFYRDALGLPVELDLEGDAGEHVLILDAGRATLELSNPAQVAMIDDVEVGRRVAPPLRVAFEVDDASAATDALIGAGAKLIAPPTRTPWESLNSRLQAPANLQITLFEERT